MTVIGEEGTPVTGEKVEVDRESPMEEGEIYEFAYNVVQIGDRWGLEKLRAFVLSKFSDLVAQFRGLEIIYWKLTDEELTFQAKGVHTSTWTEIGLATVSVCLQGLLLAVGVIIALRAIFRVVETIPIPEPKKYWWIWALAGLGVLGLIFAIGYAKGKKAKG